jgi:adenine-specific DNA-methyltransferase
VKSGDIVLDFFAGSATTGHALLEVCREANIDARFILCSSREATAKAPEKNLCRDVCAERLRRAIGQDERVKLPGDFAYLELVKHDPADVKMDFTHDQAFQLLHLRLAHGIAPAPIGPVWSVVNTHELAIVYIPEVTSEAIAVLQKLPQRRVAVYSSRPKTVAEKLEAGGKEGTSYAINDAIILGQAGDHLS